MGNKPRNKNKEDLVALAVNGSPFYKRLEMRVAEFNDDGSVMELPVRPEHKNVWGGLHGGVVASLVDSSCGTSIGPALEDGESVVTLDLRVQYLAPVREGALKAQGRVVHRTRRYVIAESEVYNDKGELVARGSTIHSVVRRKG